jgi:hypothetical protein
LRETPLTAIDKQIHAKAQSTQRKKSCDPSLEQPLNPAAINLERYASYE